MTKGQIITLTFITILFGVANLQNGIVQGIFGAILGFAITYGIIYWINKRKFKLNLNCKRLSSKKLNSRG